MPEHIMRKEKRQEQEEAPPQKSWERPPAPTNPKNTDQIGLSEQELEQFRNDPCWKFIR